jgi:putative spermidine/putrescine transport system permease protein
MFDVKRHSATLLSFPFTFVIFAFFVVPLCLVVMVSFWDYNSYSIIPDFIFTNYQDIFYGCVKSLPDLCTSFATYISSLKFVFITWLITLLTGISGCAVFIFLCV